MEQIKLLDASELEKIREKESLRKQQRGSEQAGPEWQNDVELKPFSIALNEVGSPPNARPSTSTLPEVESV